jgi:uncharacterized membrane protein
MDETVPSAADHEWREIVVHIYPHKRTVRSAVFLRRHKGAGLVWSRTLGTTFSERAPEQGRESLSQMLREVARQLEEVAERADRQ